MPLDNNLYERYINVRKKAIKAYFNRMNTMQLTAVTQTKGPVLILAGAGSGKTTVLVNRVANMVNFGDSYNSTDMASYIKEQDIEEMEKALEANSIDKNTLKVFTGEQGIKPWNILAITFTNKAAGELKERLIHMLGDEGTEINAATFHSACVRILRREGEHIGFSSSFTIYDSDDSLRVIKDIFKSLNIDDKMLPPKSALSQISRFKDDMLTPQIAIEQNASDYRTAQIAKVYEAYQKRLAAANAMDFDDIITHTVRLFMDNPEILEKYRNRYKYIMVDEYQDTNKAQYLLISLLASKHKNLCVVGDDDQSIYKFRGATIENILNFEKQFVGATVIRLEQNYRCTQTILDAANKVIENNTERKGKTLWTDNGSGDKVQIVRARDEMEEAKFIADVISDNASKGDKFAAHAILYRMNAQSNSIEKMFLRSGIPYRIFGGIKFYERLEIKDVIAYLCVINNSADNLRLKRIINQPKRGIGDATVATCEEIAYTLGITLFEVLENADQYAPLQKKAKPLMEFAAMINGIIEQVGNISISELFDIMLEHTGYMEFLKAQLPESQSRIENVLELKSNIVGYEKEAEQGSLSGFLEEIALYTDLDRYDADTDAVMMMTLHSAKGLEFDHVFIAGMEENIFPGAQSMFEPKLIEEERRLAYVGITRAKRKLYITSSGQRLLYGKTCCNPTSRFTKEIPDELCEIEDKTTRIVSSNPVEQKITTSGRKIGIGAGIGGTFGAKANAPVFSFNVSDRVIHKVFGAGEIIKITPMANDKLVEINFDKSGIRKIMANLAKLEKE